MGGWFPSEQMRCRLCCCGVWRMFWNGLYCQSYTYYLNTDETTSLPFWYVKRLGWSAGPSTTLILERLYMLNVKDGALATQAVNNCRHVIRWQLQRSLEFRFDNLRRWKLGVTFCCAVQGHLNGSINSSCARRAVMDQASQRQPDALSAGRRIYLGLPIFADDSTLQQS